MSVGGLTELSVYDNKPVRVTSCWGDFFESVATCSLSACLPHMFELTNGQFGGDEDLDSFDCPELFRASKEEVSC